MDTEPAGGADAYWTVNDDSACASEMTFEEEPVGDSERSAALDGWVAAFEREMEQTGDFASSVGAMTAHGCFDVHAVVERWILANPTRTMTLAQVQPALRGARAAAPRYVEEAVLEEDRRRGSSRSRRTGRRSRRDSSRIEPS